VQLPACELDLSFARGGKLLWSQMGPTGCHDTVDARDGDDVKQGGEGERGIALGPVTFGEHLRQQQIVLAAIFNEHFPQRFRLDSMYVDK
jgi:hypothetical protein